MANSSRSPAWLLKAYAFKAMPAMAVEYSGYAEPFYCFFWGRFWWGEGLPRRRLGEGGLPNDQGPYQRQPWFETTEQY
jgi:hypothetical protein